MKGVDPFLAFGLRGRPIQVFEANRALIQAKGAGDAIVRGEIEQLNARLKTMQADLDAARAAGRPNTQERDVLRRQVEDNTTKLAAI